MKKRLSVHSIVSISIVLMFLMALCPLTAFAEASNTWITTVNIYGEDHFSTQISEYYVESDETTDYYQVPDPWEFNNGEDGIWFFYMVGGAKNYCTAQLQNADGSEIEGAIINSPTGSSRYLTATGLQPGTSYRFFWDASQSNGKLTKNVILSFTTAGEAPASDPELVSSEGNDLIAKTYTDLELKNAPGEGYEYKFIVFNETTNQWYKLQDFSDATTFRWYTGPAGVKNLYVDIRNKSDATDVTRVELTGVNVADYGLKATLAIAPEGELAAKTQAKLTATATGGTGEYQYKFIVFNATTNQWYKLKDFGPESEFDWYTGPAGTKTLYVDVKDANGVVERAALENIVVK